MGGHVHTRAKPCLVAGEYAFNQAVKTELMKSSVIGFHAYPAVIIEYIGLLAVLMHHINELLPEGNDEIIDKLHPVGLPCRTRHMRYVQLSFVDKVLCRHGVAVPFLELIQRQGTDRVVIGTPVGEEITIAFAAAPYPHKIVEHGSKPHHGGIGVGLTPVSHPSQQIFLRLRISGIDLQQMLLVPVIGGVVIHGNFFPDTICKEAHRIFMEWHRRFYGYRTVSLTVLPLIGIQFLVRCSVVNFPVPECLRRIVDLELLRKKAFHQIYGKRLSLCHRRRRTEKCLLKLVPVLICPLIVVAYDADSGVDAVPRMYNLVGQNRSVAVPDYVRAPFFCHS